jgi:hypothetical protein
MAHISRLLVSTKEQVCFLSETRSSTITKSSIKNHFNLKDAFVVPSHGQSGGLWLMWSDEIDITVFYHNHHYIFALCTNNTSQQQYGLVCIYGDPHHRNTDVIWQQVQQFVMQNSNLSMFCMGDLNEIMHAHEKLGSTRVNVNRINAFCAYAK